MLIRFDGTDATIDIPDEPDFLRALRAAAFDWPFHSASGSAEPIARVRKRGDRYEISAPGEEPFTATRVSAVCSAIVDAVRASIDLDPARLCFHCGSVLVGGRLVLLCGTFRAGKSLLATRLAAEGCTVFGDDVLPLDESAAQGVAIGVAPRLRLPLPANTDAEFARFVRQHTAAADSRYAYVHPEGRVAARGRRAPLGAVVLLDRRTEGEAALYNASRSAALRAVILRNFARGEPAQALLDRLHGIVERLPCLTLRYSSVSEASGLIRDAFAVWPLPNLVREAADPPDEEAISAGADASLPADLRLRQNPAVRLREVDGELFLADAEGWGIHHLNAPGAGLWRLLRQPMAVSEAVEIMAGAFPEVPRRRVEEDVNRLFIRLLAQGFVIEEDKTGDCAGVAGRPSSGERVADLS